MVHVKKYTHAIKHFFPPIFLHDDGIKSFKKIREIKIGSPLHVSAHTNLIIKTLYVVF